MFILDVSLRPITKGFQRTIVGTSLNLENFKNLKKLVGLGPIKKYSDKYQLIKHLFI